MTGNKQILFAGDPHGNFAPLITAVKRFKPKAVVMLGDYDLKKPLDYYLEDIMDLTEVWWIPGNHDFEDAQHYNNLFASRLAHRGLHLKIVEIAGLRIAGLGGIFLGRVWYPPNEPKWRSKQDFLTHNLSRYSRPELSLKYRSAIWHDEWASLKQQRADILVTHEAPRTHRHGFHAIDQLAQAMGVRKVFHGHLHEHYAAFIRRGIQVFGVGDGKVADLSGKDVNQEKITTRSGISGN